MIAARTAPLRRARLAASTSAAEPSTRPGCCWHSTAGAARIQRSARRSRRTPATAPPARRGSARTAGRTRRAASTARPQRSAAAARGSRACSQREPRPADQPGDRQREHSGHRPPAVCGRSALASRTWLSHSAVDFGRHALEPRQAMRPGERMERGDDAAAPPRPARAAAVQRCGAAPAISATAARRRAAHRPATPATARRTPAARLA